MAQWLAQWTHNPLVTGSSPVGPTKYCPDGEIGRHKRLKISRSNRRAGSIPAPGTINFGRGNRALGPIIIILCINFF